MRNLKIVYMYLVLDDDAFAKAVVVYETLFDSDAFFKDLLLDFVLHELWIRGLRSSFYNSCHYNLFNIILNKVCKS